MVSVIDLRPNLLHVDITVRILNLSEPISVTVRNGAVRQLVTGTVGDSTGTTGLKLWDKDTRSLNAGDTVRIKNGFVTSFEGELKLNVAKYGDITKI